MPPEIFEKMKFKCDFRYYLTLLFRTWGWTCLKRYIEKVELVDAKFDMTVTVL